MSRRWTLILQLLLLWWSAHCIFAEGWQTIDRNDVFLNHFAVLLQEGGRSLADEIAKEHGFIVKRELPNTGIYLFEHPHIHHRSKRSADNELDLLMNDPLIKHAQQEVVLKRVKRKIVYDKQLELPIRDLKETDFYRYRPEKIDRRDNVYQATVKFKDPKFEDMWYLNNYGQSGGEEGLDMNMAVVWANGFTGKGVVVCVLDDGIDHRHPDLIDNYDPDASTDLNDIYDRKDDPLPGTMDKSNNHGTRCAGEIAATANNNVCGVGVAYEAKIGAIRVLDGPVTDALEAEALTFNNRYIHIYSASWGPTDDGATMEGPRQLAINALINGVTKGRNGLGSIFVWATGNGGLNQDDCSADGYVSRPETLSVGSVNDWGRSPFFMENCSSTLAVVPSGGEDYKGQEYDNHKTKLKVITTDLNGGCIENFQGTSSAAPLAAGCLANLLQANPNLSWRDVQHIVIRGTRIPSVDSSWIINGAGHHVSHRFGFGLMDCGKMVELAQSWNNVPAQKICNITRPGYQQLKSNDKIIDRMLVNSCEGEGGSSQLMDRLEHVQVYIKMSTQFRGETAIVLTSPAGTRSILLSPRKKDDYKGSWEFTFMTVHSWDESPKGEWLLEVMNVNVATKKKSDPTTIDDDLIDSILADEDGSNALKHLVKDAKEPYEAAGYIKEWSLVLHGTHGSRHDRTNQNKNREQKASYPTENQVSEIKKREMDLSRKANIKRAEGEIPADTKRYRGFNSRRKQEQAKDDEALVESLWNLLHGQGGREVKRKRVLDGGRTDKSILSRKKKLQEINNYVEDLIEILQKKLNE